MRVQPRGPMLTRCGRIWAVWASLALATRTLAVLALGTFTLSNVVTPAFAQADKTDPLPSWNEGPRKSAIVTFIHETTDQSSPKFRPARATNRHLRHGRHVVDRASDVHPSRLLSRPGEVPRPSPAAPEGCRAVQDRAVRQLRSDLQAGLARTRQNCRGNAFRHVGQGLRRRSVPLAGDGPASALQATVHRADLSTDARSAALLSRQRIQDVHRDRQRPGFCARL